MLFLPSPRGVALRRFGVFLALLFAWVGPASATDCPALKIVGHVQMISTRGALLVPGKLQDEPTNFLIDTGGWVRVISPAMVEKLKLTPTRRNVGQLGVTGNVTNKTVTLSSFQAGTLYGEHMPFFVGNRPFDADGTIGALIGPEILTQFDVDLDFGAQKINFLKPDHCEGNVVYWPHKVVAIVPFELSEQRHILLPVTLDGVKMTAMLDTGASNSIINLDAADTYFGLTTTSPDVKKVGIVNGDAKVPLYAHTFKTLAIAGVTISNPTLSMFADLMRIHMHHTPPINSLIVRDKDAEGLEDITLGLEQLRHLHIYIAYKEQKLYITPASEDEAQNEQQSP